MPFRPSPLMLLLVLAMIARDVAAAYCDDDLFPDDEEDQLWSSGVKFTKELSAAEYGVLSSFKTLNCCGKKYLSIEW